MAYEWNSSVHGKAIFIKNYRVSLCRLGIHCFKFYFVNFILKGRSLNLWRLNFYLHWQFITCEVCMFALKFVPGFCLRFILYLEIIGFYLGSHNIFTRFLHGFYLGPLRFLSVCIWVDIIFCPVSIWVLSGLCKSFIRFVVGSSKYVYSVLIRRYWICTRFIPGA